MQCEMTFEKDSDELDIYIEGWFLGSIAIKDISEEAKQWVNDVLIFEKGDTAKI